jgi:hypothetical protein
MALQRVVDWHFKELLEWHYKEMSEKLHNLFSLYFIDAVVTMAALSSFSPQPLLTSSQTTYVVPISLILKALRWLSLQYNHSATIIITASTKYHHHHCRRHQT